MQMMRPYADRYEAGRQVAMRLERFAGRDDVVVLALPRGGVPVAFEIARLLGVRFDVLAVRKLGVPPDVDRGLETERAELKRRERAYRDCRPFPKIAGKILILVDDGLATGASMLAAISALRELKPARIVVAAPVGSEDACALLRHWADEIVCDFVPSDFSSVGAWYHNFSPVGDDTVRNLLALQRAV